MGTFSVNFCSDNLRNWLKPKPSLICSSWREYLIYSMFWLTCWEVWKMVSERALTALKNWVGRELLGRPR